MRQKLFLGLLLSFSLAMTTVVAAAEVSKSTLEDQQSVEVTVYNSNLALIKDTRLVTLAKGESELRFMDVAAYINPVTVHIESLNFPNDLTILEQNYEYDLMNENKLLDKYVGKKLKLINWNNFQDKKEIVEATLLSNNNGQIYEVNGEIFLGHPGYKVLPSIPENLIAKPTLTWLYKNTSFQPHTIKVSYLTSNMGWKADYVLILDKEDTAASLNGWVSLDNRSGATYKNAKLKLVAGEVNRAQAEPESRGDYGAMEMMKVAAPQFTEQAFFEYHIYDLERPTTVKDNQTKQVTLLEAAGLKISKEYVVQGSSHYFMSYYRAEQNPKTPVNVYIKFKNEEKNHLGMPLPAGVMRLYKEDAAGSLQFVGEDRIGHTPKDEEVRLKIGEAFDVVAERLQLSYVHPSERIHESEWEVTLRNHKKEDIVVTLLEPIQGDWRMMSTTHEYKKVDAFTARFDVPVIKDGEVKVRYKVSIRY